MQLSERDISLLIDEVPSDLTLPRSGTDPPPRGRVREEIQHARDRGLDDDAPPTAGETILIVDDDEDIARFLEVNLRLAGYEVAVAANGEQALLQAEELRPDLVILDVLMPYGIDGFEVARRLRGSRITDDTSIIMVTCLATGDDKVLGLASGADDYVTKPFYPRELIERIRSTLRRNRQLRDVSSLTRLPGNIRIEEELERVIRTGSPFALLYCDLDHFKAYNDHEGFFEGDRVIRTTARILQK